MKPANRLQLENCVHAAEKEDGTLDKQTMADQWPVKFHMRNRFDLASTTSSMDRVQLYLKQR